MDFLVKPGNASLQCVLLLGAHCDDLEIGCGGTIARLAHRHPHAHFVWVTLSSDNERAKETRTAAQRLLNGVGQVTLRIESFRGSYFPYEGEAIKDYFEVLQDSISPDLILTHARGDLHQDHRLVNELTWNTFRNHLILEYEIPKYDGDLGSPNAFVPLGKAEMEAKVALLLECFPSQQRRTWFSRATFEAIARLRGIECNAPEGFAEAFFLRKARLEM